MALCPPADPHPIFPAGSIRPFGGVMLRLRLRAYPACGSRPTGCSQPTAGIGSHRTFVEPVRFASTVFDAGRFTESTDGRGGGLEPAAVSRRAQGKWFR